MLKKDTHGHIQCYHAGCRCNLCREANAYSSKAIRKNRPTLEPGDPRHGTGDGYRNWNCRCVECKASHNEEGKKLRAKRKPLEPDDPRHGTRNAYISWSCRCEPCKKASRDYYLQRKEA